ncbi:MAG: hypothetical protein ABIQ99_08415 [Thermoflexales bacterium]
MLPRGLAVVFQAFPSAIAPTLSPAAGVLSGAAGTAITCLFWIVVVSRQTANKPKSERRPK